MQPITAAAKALLTAQEIHNLTIYKWRYALESEGFTSQEAGRLIFLRWRILTGKLGR